MTNTKNKDIAVRFVEYHDYGQSPKEIVKLGTISINQILHLQNMFENNNAKNSCLYNMMADYTDHVSCGESTTSRQRERGYDLSWLSHNNNFVPPCDTQTRCGNVVARMQLCAEKLCDGKCVDEFARRTLGMTLFREKYAKKSQGK